MVRRGGSSRRVSLALIGLLAVSGLLVPGLGAGQPSAVAASCWETAITEQWSNLELIGSVLRVSVWGKNGLPVVVRSLGGFETVGYTGTKPEYGPFVAEFAPLSEGIYFIEPQGLGKVFQIWLDGRNYTRVNFTSKSCPRRPRPPRGRRQLHSSLRRRLPHAAAGRSPHFSRSTHSRGRAAVYEMAEPYRSAAQEPERRRPGDDSRAGDRPARRPGRGDPLRRLE